MTGTQANIGRGDEPGGILAVEHLNAAGGVEGYKFELIIEDFKNVDVNLAISGVRKLISIDKAPGVLAAYSAPHSRSPAGLRPGQGGHDQRRGLQPQAGGQTLPAHHPGGPSSRWCRPCSSTSGTRVPAVSGSSTCPDPSGELPAKQYVKPIWTEMGGTIVAMEAHQPGITDFSAYLARIKAGNPDVIICYSTGQDMAYVVKGAREMGMNCPVVSPTGWPTTRPSPASTARTCSAALISSIQRTKTP